MNQLISGVQKKSETGGQIFALVAALILAAVLASGCSTPVVQGSLNQNNTPAVSSANYVTSSSYTNCVQTMTTYGLQYQCYNVATPTTASYNQYSSHSSFTKGVSGKTVQEALQIGYANYLSAIDQNDLAEMNAQWDAIVAAHSVANSAGI